MSTHWPAPWKWSGDYPAQLLDAEGNIICEMCPASAEDNMPLLKAAPDLLEACRAALPLLKAMYASVPATFGEGPVNALVERAIAKAEGRS